MSILQTTKLLAQPIIPPIQNHLEYYNDVSHEGKSQRSRFVACGKYVSHRI